MLSALLNNCKIREDAEEGSIFFDANRIKVMICITMYSEKLSELEKSLNGVGKNIVPFLNMYFLYI